MIDALVGLAVGLPVAAAVSLLCMMVAGLLASAFEWLMTGWQR
jgi:hypothetical protein